MKSIVSWRNKFIAFGMIVFLMLSVLACPSHDHPPPKLALFGATHYSANPSNTSYLYDVTDGITTLIGDIGFRVNGMAYNTITTKLYGITEGAGPGAGSQLIEIDVATGKGTFIAEITVPAVTSIDENNGWNTNYITSIGATGSDFYAQSFIANVSEITKFGVVIQEIEAEGQLILSIADDNGLGAPNVSAPLYQGTLKNPTTTGAWFYEEGINIPVTVGQKYWVLIDGYNNAGATGMSGIGRSNTYTDTGEGMIYSNSAGVGAWSSIPSMPLAIYVEGVPTFSNPTFNSKGELFAWNNTDNSLCTIDLTTGIATYFPNSGVTALNYGLAFNNSDVLYLVNGGGGDVYTIDQTTGAGTSVGSISGLPNNMAHHGDFHPLTGIYWGLDNTDDYTPTRNLLVIDIGTLTLQQSIPTLNSLHVLAFGYRYK